MAVTEQAQFIVTQQNGIPILEVTGDIDVSNITQFQKAMVDAAGSDGDVVTSLRKVRYLDSRMVHELFTLAKRFAQSRRAFALVSPESKSARYILDTAGVPKIVACFNSIEDAIQSLDVSGNQAAD